MLKHQIVALMVFVLAAGCATGQKAIIFTTPFGEIEKGSSKAEAMGILGNPHDISFEGKTTVWHYFFGDKYLFAYFANNRIIKVVEK